MSAAEKNDVRVPSGEGAGSKAARGMLEKTVGAGLRARPKRLPPWLFYDARGSELFEQITLLPEYYLTRAERSILQEQADAIAALAAEGTAQPVNVVELGAGSATKTQLLLEAVVRRQGHCLFLPIDVSADALAGAVTRLRKEAPLVQVQPFAGTHMDALGAIRSVGVRQLVLFLGSSIGNYADDEAIALLTAVARQLEPGAALLLGADRRKDPRTLMRAYDDGAGVTAAFNMNLLVRLNRELGANFDVRAFQHEARWNEARSCMEMHLVSLWPQRVNIPHVGDVVFEAGESIHTESSIKYSEEHVDRLLRASGFSTERVFFDADKLFALHLARRRDATPPQRQL